MSSREQQEVRLLTLGEWRGDQVMDKKAVQNEGREIKRVMSFYATHLPGH